MIKILHFADVHLDSPFSLCDVRQSEQRRNELRSAFTSVMAYVRTSGIKYVLIPGDLFDYGYVSKETVELVRREFEVNPSTRFIIAPGNHDPYSSESVYAKVEFPDNVYIFDSSELTALEFPDDGVDIYGYAFTSPYLDSCPFAGQRVRHPERINILIGHGDTTYAISRYCPISERDITAFGADYTALGHIHNTDGIHTTEIVREGSRSAVVWNPWIAKSKRMPDFGDKEYHKMICVETANARNDARTLDPDGFHVLACAIIRR